LLLSVIGGVLVGLLIVVTPLGRAIGFGALPPAFFAVLVIFIVTYLALVELVKRPFYRAAGWTAD
jgi:Mg2+-importing ATPase